ncbi:MAG: choice-of-anchor D domain-containing protein, partial [bacterium]
FDINSEVPSTADGLYKFLVRKAYAANGDTMAPALSDTIKNSSDQPATLYISRQGKLTANTSKIDFDTTQAGIPKDQKLILKNVTCAEITLTQASVSAPFKIPTLPNGAKVAPDSSYSLVVRFDPSNRTTYARTLKLYYNSNQQTDSVTVQVAGVSRGPELVFLPPTALKFDTVYVDSTASKTVRLTNRKASNTSLSDTLRITSIALKPDTIFSVNPTTLTMAPGDTQTVTVNFKPAEGKSYTNALEFVGNDFVNKPGGKVSFTVSGTGQEKTPPPQVTTLIVDWPGGIAGYTNSSRLLISTPIDTSGIKEARWKFTQKDNDPPASAGDTLNGGAGKFISLKKDSARFEIPLKITAGRWNCYIWLEGTNGTSGYRDARPTVVTYDITPPTFSKLPYVSMGWNRTFVGHTKADILTVCWDASDSSAITEVRWKFTKTRLAPQNVDTTGSRRISSNCVTIPLKEKIIEGRWYCYVWLVDGSGNSSNATEIAVKYDVTAPQAPSVPIARNILRNDWFNTNRSPLILTLKQIRDAAYVHWKFKTRPTPTTLHDDEGPLIVRNAQKDTVFSVIFNSLNWCGEDSLYFWLEDSAGNAKPERFAVTGYKFDMCSPVITRLRTGEAVVSKPTSPTNSHVVIDTVKIFDHTKVVRDSVLYRFGGSRASQPPQRLRSVQGTKDR